jgi:DNA polymerase-3 subunit alpha/error-prone DNA polymerase
MPSRLGIRSAYSFLYGLRSPEEIAERAASYGAACLAVTDRDNLYGVHSIVEATRTAGLRPVIGAELLDARGGSSEGAGGSAFAFARDRRGFSRLCEILSDKRRAGAAFDLAAALRADSQGLVLASLSPELLGALAGKVPCLYAAISPRSLACLRKARELGLPLVAVDDATFLDPGDEAVHAVLRSIALGKTVGTLAAEEVADPGGRLIPQAQLERRLASWPEALRGADEVAALCDFDTIFDGFVFPDYGVGGSGDGGAATDFDPARAAQGFDAARELRRRVIEGAEKRYGELSDAIMGRIDYELGVIGAKGFAPYFLVMDDIVGMANPAGGTCGRGSGAASIVSYALSITNVDPIEYDLYFERFLNMARPDPPDIDVDFAWDERDDLIRRVIERFGKERCARVANHNFFRPRSALRETAKAYGLPDGEVSLMERELLEGGAGSSALAARESLWAEILAVAKRVEGLPRGLSMHCGGLVIAPGPINRYAPIESSAEGFPLLAWEKEGTEAAGLVKIDLLGNRSLAVIRDALANLEEEGVALDRSLWRPADDAATVAALARGDSMGVFYIESPAMRQLQRKTGRGDFAHIVIHSSIIRPAANKFIAEYVRRLKADERGERNWKALHPRLERIFDETYGILCYQEDVSKTAVALAGFDEAEADKLRKVIAKKAGHSKLPQYEARFFEGARAKGVDEETISKVWEMMLSFDGYSFCKPHSASYAMVSFRSAYLRVHYPAEFIAAVLSNQGGFYRPCAYVSEARRMGLEVAGPDANLSAYRYRGEGRRVVVGLMAVARLSLSGARAIVAERERGGAYRSLADFAQRAPLCRDDIVALVASGAFDSLEPPSPRSAQARFLLGAMGSGAAGARSGGQGLLFGPPTAAPAAANTTAPAARLAPAARAARALPVAEGESRALAPRRSESELREEYAALGFLRDRHPFALWEREIARLGRVRAVDLPRYVGAPLRLLGWPVTQKEVMTKDGLEMDFVSFEDETALYETVLFPEVYERYRKLLFDQVPLIVIGTVKDDQGALNVEVESLMELKALA